MKRVVYMRKQNFTETDDVLGMCGESLTSPMILEDRTMNVERYFEEILPVALKCGNKMLGNKWKYPQDDARPSIHSLSRRWCADHLHTFISKNRWPSNSSDSCPLDYSLWIEVTARMDWNMITIICFKI